MGTGPPSKIAVTTTTTTTTTIGAYGVSSSPTRSFSATRMPRHESLDKPFDRTRPSCWTKGLLLLPPEKSVMRHNKVDKLQQLLWLQDWQRVLVRVHLYPEELHEWMSLEFSMDHVDEKGGTTKTPIHLKVLPLHLACALDPPLTVIQVFLMHCPEAANMFMQSWTPKRRTSGSTTKAKHTPKSRLYTSTHTKPWWNMVRPLRDWSRRRQGAFPVVDQTWMEDDDDDDDDNISYDDKYRDMDVQNLLSPSSEVYRYETHGPDDSSSSSSSSSESSLSSRHSWGTDNKGIILQLSSTGGLTPMPIHSETESTSEASQDDNVHDTVHDNVDPPSATTTPTRLFGVTWDLRPLYKFILLQERHSLLPLHLACLYGAHASVLQALVDVYPLAVLTDILGMLPIHWVAAGWRLERLVDLDNVLDDVMPKRVNGPLEQLMVLKKALFESLNVRSGNHGLTPKDYVQECMEEGDYKRACLRILEWDKSSGAAADDDDDDDDDDTLSDADNSDSSPSIIFDDSETSSTIIRRQYSRRHYHYDRRRDHDRPCDFPTLSAMIANQEWDRVLACVEDQPSIASEWLYEHEHDQDYEHEHDIHTTTRSKKCQRLLIHLACAYGAPLGLIALLVEAYPEGVSTLDPYTQCLPLHLVCRCHCRCRHNHNSTLSIIQLLLETCPESTKAIDANGRLPLHLAAAASCTCCCRCCRTTGCSISLSVLQVLCEYDLTAIACYDAHGKRPLDYAIQVYKDGGGDDHHHQVVVEFLRAAQGIYQARMSI